MIYTVVKIEEDVDFGCEERDGAPVMAVLTLKDEEGLEQIIRYPDKELYRLGIDEGTKISWDPKRGSMVKWTEEQK